MVFPWIQFLGKKKKLSDIEFLSIKEFDGKLKENETATAGGAGPTDGALLTAASGKDLYLASASVTGHNNTTGGTVRVLNVELHINGVVHETLRMVIGDLDATGNPKASERLVFQTKGVKVAATQVIKIRVVANPDIVVESNVIGFEETTGASPAV